MEPDMLMSADARPEPKRPSLAPLALTLMVLIAVFHLGSAAAGRSLFRASRRLRTRSGESS